MAKEWSKEYARFIGRIIFADFLEYPLSKYREFIEKVEGTRYNTKRHEQEPRKVASLLRGRHELTRNRAITERRLSKARVALKGDIGSPRIIAKVVKSGDRFSIRYTYEEFNRVYEITRNNTNRNTNEHELIRVDSSLFRVDSCILYKLRRISSRNELTHRIIKGIIEHQKEYLKTGDPIDLVPFSQVQLADWLNRREGYVEERKAIRLSGDPELGDPGIPTPTSVGVPAGCPSPGLPGFRITLNDGRTPTICNSWVSRLVNGLSVITPSGEEKPLKWFFQTQRQINKRLIKKILDKENEDLQSGKLRKPYTDNEIRLLLEDRLRSFYHRSLITDYRLPSLSRWTVGHCRKDMGIPPAKRRLSGYKYPPLSANFSMLYPLVIEEALRNAPSSSGIYEFRLKSKEIEYPKAKTNVIYIGRTMNIKKRLREHLGRKSKNHHIKGFLKEEKCLFRYILLRKNCQEEEKRLYKLFTDTYGAPPKCNRVKP